MRSSSIAIALVLITVLPIAYPAALETDQDISTGPQRAAFSALVAGLNLDFEASNSPTGWMAGGQGYRTTVESAGAHSGERCLRFEHVEEGRFATATGRIPAETAHGKRIRFSGFVRTEAITRGWAGLWMRVDGPGGVLAFDNMADRGVTGTTGWERYVIEVDVPEHAAEVYFGALLTGDGSVWVDTLSFELIEQPPPPPTITVRGAVTGPDDAPVAGALVALNPPNDFSPPFRTHSDDDGRFSVELPAGTYAVTATAPGLTAAFLPASDFGPDSTGIPLSVALGEGGFTISGTVSDQEGAPVKDQVVTCFRVSADIGDVFYTTTDADGRYEIDPVPGERFVVIAASDEFTCEPVEVEGGADATAEITVLRLGPAPKEVVAWINAHAIPLTTVEAGSGFEDMAPLAEIVGDARVVALGEATHGSREFFQLKHRMLEFLVEEMGFSVFAIEANWPECRAINNYVLYGEGDPKQGLDGIYFWTWNTEEVLAQIEWMRAYNVDPRHERKVQFVGFDMQTTTVAAHDVFDYLESVDPPRAEATAKDFANFAADDASKRIADLSKEDRTALAAIIDDLLGQFEEHQSAWIDAAGEQAWVIAEREVVLLRQALAMSSQKPSARDRAMADNVEWVLATHPPGTRMVVWAHNGHVSRAPSEAFEPMGSFLSASLGDDYVAIGFAFNQGSFQAIDWSQGRDKGRGLVEHTVGPAPEDSLDAALAGSGLPIFVLDLHKVPPRGIVARWFRAPHLLRQIGAVFSGESRMGTAVVVTDHFDAVAFVNRTTRARPVE